MSFRGWGILFALLLCAVGAVLLSFSAELPEWTDLARANALFAAMPPDDTGSAAYRAFTDRWFDDLAAVRTHKWQFFDLGSGLVAFACSGVLAIMALRIRNLADAVRLQTPKHRLTIAGLASTAWFGAWFSSSQSLWLGLERREYPPWADSIFIGQAGITLTFAAGYLLMIFVLWLFFLRRAHLPAVLWIWPRASLMNRIYSALAAFSVLAGIAAIHDGLFHGPYFLIPAALLWIYATLTARAAAISQFPRQDTAA
jgi:hypothetical protein